MRGLYARGVLATLAALCTFAATAGPAEAADKVRVGKAVAHVYMFSPVNVGVAAGIFAKHGIDVEIIAFGGAPKLHQGMTADSIDIGIGSGPDLIFIAKGVPELAVATIVNKPSALGVVVAPDSPIRSFDDLKGKKIGVTGVGAVTYWLALELARVKGWGPNGVIPVSLGGQLQAEIAGLKLGQFDAFMTSSGVAFGLEEAKQARWIGSVDTYVAALPNQVIYAANKLINEKPDLLRRFMQGYMDTIAFMKSHREETVRLVMPVTGASKGVQERDYDMITPLFSDTGKFSAEALATVARSAVELKILDKEPDMSKLYTEAFLPKN
jgi:NitT/TauT family transport system substrate-binding protein